MRKLILTALVSPACTYLVVAANNKTMKLENKRVRVSEIVYEAGVPRERHIRSTDPVIVFLDDRKYQRIDSKTVRGSNLARQGRGRTGADHRRPESLSDSAD